MKPLKEFKNHNVKFLFTDIDDTLTDHGRLGAAAYAALWQLMDAGIGVIPVTGRPAGWCEMIARLWPVVGVVGENGGFYFRYDEANKKMKRHFFFDRQTQAENRKKLESLQQEILAAVPGTAVASDQFSRLMDLAIDFNEDVSPLPDAKVEKIVSVFKAHGAQAKISSIHVNGWFGDYDKLSMCREFTHHELGLDLDANPHLFAFSGDSPNDEPMFAFFENSFAVANVQAFLGKVKNRPAYISNENGGAGFVEIANALIKKR